MQHLCGDVFGLANKIAFAAPPLFFGVRAALSIPAGPLSRRREHRDLLARRQVAAPRVLRDLAAVHEQRLLATGALPGPAEAVARAAVRRRERAERAPAQPAGRPRRGLEGRFTKIPNFWQNFV